MAAHDVELTTTDGPMRLYVAIPDDTPTPTRAVIVIQEAFGVNSHIEDVTRRFAALGYLAVAPALFHRSGGGTAPYDDFSKVLPMFEGVTDDAILMDVDATLAHLAAAGVDAAHTALVGFCMGGRVSFLVAANRTIGATVGFYGGGIINARFPQFPPLIGQVSTLQSPWLGLFGDADTGIPIDEVEAIRAALDADAPVAHDVVRYPGAEHGFHCDQRPSYNAAAAVDAWAKTLAWFDTNLA